MTYAQAMLQSKSKTERQAIRRAHGQGNRAARQKASRRTGPNVRVHNYVQDSNPSAGYSVVRLRDGVIVSK